MATKRVRNRRWPYVTTYNPCYYWAARLIAAGETYMLFMDRDRETKKIKELLFKKEEKEEYV